MDTPQPTPTPVPPPPAPSTRKPRRFSIWRLFWGAIIVLFGVQLLASNYGWHWAWSFDVWRLWPLVIILWGVSMLMRGHRGAQWVGGGLALLVLVLVAGIGFVGNNSSTREVKTTAVQVGREATAITADVHLKVGAVNLNLTGGGADILKGALESNVAELTTTSSLRETTQIVEVEQRSVASVWWWPHLKNTLTATVGTELPTAVTIDSGAADLNLDFRLVKLTALSVSSGASSLDLKLGDLVDRQTVAVDAGASSVTVSAPKSLGVKLTLHAGASSKTLPSELKSVGNNQYETDGFATAAKQLDLSIDAGASSITFTWE